MKVTCSGAAPRAVEDVTGHAARAAGDAASQREEHDERETATHVKQSYADGTAATRAMPLKAEWSDHPGMTLSARERSHASAQPKSIDLDEPADEAVRAPKATPTTTIATQRPNGSSSEYPSAAEGQLLDDRARRPAITTKFAT